MSSSQTKSSHHTKKSAKAQKKGSTKTTTSHASSKHKEQPNTSRSQVPSMHQEPKTSPTSTSTHTGSYASTWDNESQASNFNTPTDGTTPDETTVSSASHPYSQTMSEVDLLGIGAWTYQEEQYEKNAWKDHNGDEWMLVEKFGDMEMEELNYDYVRKM